MKVRVITSAIIVAIALPLLIFSQYITYPIALSLVSVAAVYELLKVIGIYKEWSVSVPAYVISAALPIASYFVGSERRIEYLLVVFVILFAYLLYIMGAAVFSRGKIGVSKIGEVFLTVTYVVASFTSLSTVRYIEQGLYCLMLVFFIAWGCDVAAYVVGTLIGKHKLIPEVSPKKSVEGAVGGVIGSIVFSLLFALFADKVLSVNTNYISVALIALVLSIVSQIGDLMASLIKREYGVKDYSNLMPGHGGIMDRFDSVLAVATPLLVFCLIIPPFT